MSEKLSDEERRVLAKLNEGDAYWTSDVAYVARLRTTGAARRQLERLSRKGFVERVVQGGAGQPSSWRRTPAGRLALQGADHV